MKCKRCGEQMNRVKVKDKTFIYRCPQCGWEMKNKDRNEDFQRAYNGQMAEAEK